MSAPDTLWYYADASNEPVGPLPFAELERLATAGVIHAATHIIEKGGSEWKKFASVFLPPPPTRVEPIQPPRDERKPITAKAFAGTVTLLEDKIRISRNLFAAIGKGGLTEIPLTAIRSIRWKAPGLLKQGYIQFLLEGPIQTACGFFSIAKDSHAVIFS